MITFYYYSSTGSENVTVLRNMSWLRERRNAFIAYNMYYIYIDTAKSNADFEQQIWKHLRLNVFLNHKKSWLVLLKIR